MFKWYERLRCNHEWELMTEKRGVRIFTCIHCAKMITSNSYDEDPVNKYVFEVSDRNDISNGDYTFKSLLDQRAVLLSCLSKLAPKLFRIAHKDTWGTKYTTNFVLAFKYDVNYYDVYCTVLDSKYEHLFKHVEVDEDVYQDYNGISFTYAISTMVKKIEQGLNIEEFHRPKYGSELCEKLEPVTQAVNNYLTPDADRQIIKEELNRLYGDENCEAPIDTDTAVARVKGITTDIAGNLTLTAEAIKEISAGVSKIGSFAPEAFYKKEGEESPHLNVCRESTDEEDLEDYPED